MTEPDTQRALSEMTRRRDEWKAKAEGYDAVRLALRDAIAGKFGEDGPRTMSRIMWAGVAADEKKRADDAEAERAAAVAASQKLAAENARLNSKISEISDGLADFIEEFMRAFPELRPFRARLADAVSALRAYAKGGDK
jgi:hypothetical protein